jgi:hypothetical protein
MSTNEPTQRDGPAADRDTGALDRLREPLFVVGVLAGVVVLAVGFAFFVLGLSMDTTPPAPYFATVTDRLLVLGGSVGAMVLGAFVVRGSANFAGW